MANSRSLPYGQVRRALIVLLSTEGPTNTVIAQRVGLAIRAVGIYLQRFIEKDLMGL
jgi:DNA-binding NarL/FixJ family response regulator